MMRLLIVLMYNILLIYSQTTFYDTPNTYARYRSWVVSGTGTLKISFHTYKKYALLLYAEGGPGSQDFLKLQLANQELIVQTNFGSGIVSFAIGKNLGDGDFHTIQINVKQGFIVVNIDDKLSKEHSFDNSAIDNTLELRSAVYIGGVNKYDTTQVQQDMPLEPRFAGCIRDFKFTRAGGERFGIPLTDGEEGTAEGCKESSCATVTPLNSCKNWGACVPHQEGHICNCDQTGYVGETCTTAATAARFQASEYIKYRAEQEPSPTKFDSLSFRLKTSRANGVIFYYKTDNFFMAVEVVDTFLSVNVGFGTKQQLLTLDTVFISDNIWHDVHIGRYETFITVEVDRTQKQDRLANPTPVVYNKDVYIGGGDNLYMLDGIRSKLNYVGCMQQLIFNKRQMLKEAKSGVPGYTMSPTMEWTCSEIQHVPIMFGSDRAKLELEPWMLSRDLTLQFKTTNPDGVIAFIGTEQNYLSLELDDGEVVFSAYKDGETYETRAGRDLADSKWHILTARYDVSGIQIHLYGDIGVGQDTKKFSSPGDMNFQTPLLLGVADVGTPSLKPGYRGCMRGLSVRGDVIDLYTLLATRPPGVVAGCSSLAEACTIQPCYHGSVCHQEMNSYTCDCAGTGYEGLSCSTESPSLTFSGAQYLRYLSSSLVRNDVDKISLRFRTQSRKGLLMFITSDYKYNTKFLYFEIYSEQVYMYINFGVTKLLKIGAKVSDGRWHVLTYHREYNSITLTLDTDQVKYEILGKRVEFGYQYTYLASAGANEWRNIMRLTKSRAAFDGCLQQATINGVNLISTHSSALILSNARPGCKFQETTEEQIAAFIRPSYIRLPPWEYDPESSLLNFQFRTKEERGLLLFHGTLDTDYLAIELEQGRLKCTLVIGDGKTWLSSLATGLDNNAWHNVSLSFTPKAITFDVDGQLVSKVVIDGEFDFIGGLYVGGAPDDVISLISETDEATQHYIGCVRALTVNNVIQDLLQAGNDKPGVMGTCDGTCAAYPCMNGATCRQLDDTFDCLCTGTFHKGDTCSEDTTVVKFAPGSSLSYSLYDHKTTIKDDVHLKFKTTNSNGGLVRIETHDPNQFINVIINKEHLELSLKMAGKQINLRSDFKVNDDTPHTISLWRRNSDITYSFDGSEKKTESLGVRGTVEFGVITKLLLSFSVNNMGFSGCMLAFDYNGITPLDNVNLPNIEKSPGLTVGSCEVVIPPTTRPDDVTQDNKSRDNNVEATTRSPYDTNSTTVQGQRKSATGLALPFIICIAIGSFLLILVITYGISRFVRRKQGVYKTNEEKRPAEQRVEYGKLSTIHDEAFELPSKRELYM